jgi:hypothetical protein
MRRQVPGHGSGFNEESTTAMTMTRAMRRASQRNGERLQALPWNDLVDVTEFSRQRHAELHPGVVQRHRPDGVWMNNHYTVQVFDGLEVLGRPATKLMIRRNDSGPIHSWYDFQRIKNALYGDEATAIEVYPPESKLTDVANMYWLWVLTE